MSASASLRDSQNRADGTLLLFKPGGEVASHRAPLGPMATSSKASQPPSRAPLQKADVSLPCQASTISTCRRTNQRRRRQRQQQQQQQKIWGGGGRLVQWEKKKKGKNRYMTSA